MYTIKRVIIIGAGTTGEFMCRELINDSKHRMNPIGFLDDNKKKVGRELHGVPIFGNVQSISNVKVSYDEIYICIPSATRNEMRQIVNICKMTDKPFKTLPSISESFISKPPSASIILASNP